jgi:hypothetical protein
MSGKNRHRFFDKDTHKIKEVWSASSGFDDASASVNHAVRVAIGCGFR